VPHYLWGKRNSIHTRSNELKVLEARSQFTFLESHAAGFPAQNLSGRGGRERKTSGSTTNDKSSRRFLIWTHTRTHQQFDEHLDTRRTGTRPQKSDSVLLQSRGAQTSTRLARRQERTHQGLIRFAQFECRGPLAPYADRVGRGAAGIIWLNVKKRYIVQFKDPISQLITAGGKRSYHDLVRSMQSRKKTIGTELANNGALR